MTGIPKTIAKLMIVLVAGFGLSVWTVEDAMAAGEKGDKYYEKGDKYYETSEKNNETSEKKREKLEKKRAKKARKLAEKNRENGEPEPLLDPPPGTTIGKRRNPDRG